MERAPLLECSWTGAHGDWVPGSLGSFAGIQTVYVMYIHEGFSKVEARCKAYFTMFR